MINYLLDIMLQILMFSFNINLVMGVGFNSCYHIADSSSFITSDRYVIFDPHECTTK